MKSNEQSYIKNKKAVICKDDGLFVFLGKNLDFKWPSDVRIWQRCFKYVLELLGGSLIYIGTRVSHVAALDQAA